MYDGVKAMIAREKELMAEAGIGQASGGMEEGVTV